MKLIKRYSFIVLIICIALFSLGCHDSNHINEERNELKNEMATSESNDNISKENEKIVWDEINENGVDEDLLLKNIDEETLTYIGKELQGLCDEIDEKGREDKNYWLTGQWYTDVVDSEQYKNVLSLDKKAMKPLFLIIYKSPNSGIYEWVCSKALDEVYGLSDRSDNSDKSWSNSKEFLKVFIETVLEEKN